MRPAASTVNRDVLVPRDRQKIAPIHIAPVKIGREIFLLEIRIRQGALSAEQKSLLHFKYSCNGIGILSWQGSDLSDSHQRGIFGKLDR